VRLSRHLRCTLRELIPRVSARDFFRELAADRVEPLPDPWLQAGTIAATVANSNRAKPPWAKASDFIPRVVPQESVNAQKMRWRAYIKARSGKNSGL